MRGVSLPLYSPVKASGVDVLASAHSYHGLAPQNASNVPFTYAPGVVTTGVVTLESRVAGEESAFTLAFTPHAALRCTPPLLSSERNFKTVKYKTVRSEFI